MAAVIRQRAERSLRNPRSPAGPRQLERRRPVVGDGSDGGSEAGRTLVNGLDPLQQQYSLRFLFLGFQESQVMLILHGGSAEHRFLLWGESPQSRGATPAPRRRGRTNSRETYPLPFEAAAADLVAALAQALPDWALTKADFSRTTVLLPTAGGAPAASHALVAEPPPPGAAFELAPWSVAAVSLSPSRVVALLGCCLDRPTLAPGFLIGTTLTYWATALRFASGLVAREQFLPGLTPADAGWRACWKPVLSGAYASRFNALARAMPPACRALGSAAPAASAVLAEFLANTVDALVRAEGVPVPPRADVARATRRRAAFPSVHDEWLHALRAGTGEMSGGKVAPLAEQVRAWQRPVTTTADAPFRLCFRLEEPSLRGASSNGQHRDGTWTVRYLLQARDDPSLLVPAAEVWTANGRPGKILRRPGFQPREFLLTSLGQAAGLCPPIETSMESAAPDAFTVDTAGAHGFLTNTAWLLEQAGFGMLLPAWWTRRGTKQRLTVNATAKTPSLSGGGLSLDDLIRFEWRVALGDQVLTRQELEALARLKVPLVQVRGQWVQVSSDEIQSALAFWKKRGADQGTVRDVVRMALGAAPAPGALALGTVTAEGELGDFLARLEGRADFEELPAPRAFTGTLRPYQVRGYSWLAFLRRWGLGACLADDMGLGKTVQTLALIQRDRDAGERRPVLLICPMSVVGNWKKEAERFTPDLPVLIHHGLSRSRGESFPKQARKQALVVSSYGLLHRDLPWLQKVEWAGVVLDEAQNIKNPGTKQAQAARSLAAGYRIALTGTPVENHVGDLWSIAEFLNPGFLGNQAEFRRAFFVPIQVQHDHAAAERLKRLTGPFVLRRLKTDKAVIADLPDKLEMKVFCNLTREQASLYAAVVADLERQLRGAEGIQRKGVILATLSKLKQVCNHPAQFLGDNSPIPDRSGKLARLTEMLEEVLQTGDRALVFTQFTEMGELIRRHVQETLGVEVLFLHGSVPRGQRERMVARFQGEDGPRVFLLSLKAGGSGLNLTAANHVFHFDRWWNPAVEDQATDRAFRIGQRRNVQVHKFVCVGTLEEKIDEMIEHKKGVAARVVGAGEAWLTELSNEKLKEVFALRPEALGE
jgi:SNF2 family DNA or RNA helicase